MKPRFKKKLLFVPFAVAALLALVSFIVMQLWNGLLPDILHVSTITFWQAMGIFILCKILFGFGKGGHMGPPWMRGRMGQRFRDMDPEAREQFKREMKDRMCNWKGRFSSSPGSEKTNDTEN